MYVEGEVPYSNGNGNGYGVLPVMQYAPMGNNNGGFFGNGDGIWAILLFAMIFGNGGWGNGFGGGMGGAGNMLYDINANTNRGFDNIAIHNGIDEIQSTLTNGFANISNAFANAEVSRCNSQANLLQTLNANQNATTQAMNSLAMGLQQCCCDNRAGLADLKYTVATEACAERNAVSQGIRDVIESNTRNTQAILDKLCQQEIDAKNDQIATLRSQLSMADLRASQTAQTAQILAGQTAEVDALYNRLSNCPVPSTPVYGRIPIFTCNGQNGCGCSGLNVQ